MTGYVTLQKDYRLWHDLNQRMAASKHAFPDETAVYLMFCNDIFSTAHFEEHNRNNHVRYPSNDGEKKNKINGEQKFSGHFSVPSPYKT